MKSFNIAVWSFLAFTATAVKTPIDVVLQAVNNTKVRATVTNTNAQTGYNLLIDGSILDDRPIEKVDVFNTNGSKADFTGFRIQSIYDSVPEESFFSLGPGQSREIEFDIAETHDVYSSAITTTYEVTTKGAFRYASLNSTELVPHELHFASNRLAIDIDQAQAALVSRALETRLKKRAALDGDCNPTQNRFVKQALDRCTHLALNAGADSINGNSVYFLRYFWYSQLFRVTDYMLAIAGHCRAGGTVTIFCDDRFALCKRNSISATRRGHNDITLCEKWYELPLEKTLCDGYTSESRAGNLIHEMTHCPGVIDPPREDFTYGAKRSENQPPDRALENADNYALYATELDQKCHEY
jgi:deuterolysin